MTPYILPEAVAYKAIILEVGGAQHGPRRCVVVPPPDAKYMRLGIVPRRIIARADCAFFTCYASLAMSLLSRTSGSCR